VPLPSIGLFGSLFKSLRAVLIRIFTFALIIQLASAQQTLGSINGTVSDASGAVVQGASVKIRAVATNLEVSAQTKADGSFTITDIPIGTYEVTFVKEGFETADYPQILVQGSRTTTVNAKLKPGAVSSTVTVEGTPLLNETDNANGYTLGPQQIEAVPLGTGSFTQLAILAPGVSADFLSGSGSNEGLGNQGIVANGQRDTSNQFTFNGVNANNLFNGNSTSNISDSRFTLNTGEIFGAGGQVQTNSSVFDAIGQALPTPPLETIQEVHVTTSMYDASMGSASGAHIETTTKSGTNNLHGQAYEYFQSNAFDAAPTFLAPNPFFSGAPPLHRNVFGVTLGGPIIKNKLFFFGSYQGQRISDALSGAFNGVPTLPGLTDSNRDAANLATLVNASDNCSGSSCITSSQVDPVAVAIIQAKTSSGQFIIPSALTPSDPRYVENSIQPFNSFVKGPSSQFNATQANGNIDYIFGPKDRLAGKYYFQSDPTTIPFAVSQVPGFPQTMHAGSQLVSIDNTTVFTPNATWENRLGFVREVANATTAQPLTPSAVNLNLLGSTFFPGITITSADDGAPDGSGFVPHNRGHEMRIGPSTNFANAGIFQNEYEASSIYHWVHRRHTVAFGGIFDYMQLNVANRENQVASLTFRNFKDFATGTLGQDRSGGQLLNGETNRHFRSRSAGLFVQDDYKLASNLTINAGLRWDWDGPLYETNGLMTNFYPSDYKYDLASDSFGTLTNGEPGIGLVVAGNNRAFGFKGVSNSTLTGRQWMFAPRIGIAWSPSRLKNVVVRGGFGMYADRGEYFTELSASAGLGISGPFSVTTQEPFTVPVSATCPNNSVGSPSANCLSLGPFAPSAPPPSNLSQMRNLIHNQSDLSGCPEPVTPTCTPTTDAAFAALFGGYDPTNKLPYSENWSLDLQWQPRNDIVLTLAYIGNHSVHQPLPIPFNQPGVATPSKPINGQTYSYGFQPLDGPDIFSGNPLVTEQVQTTIGEFSNSDGNTALRVPYIGFNPNADFWKAEGISNYNALQFQATKRMSHGFQVNASYTYSHSLDEGSGLGAGLFFNGNDPLKPRTAYGSSDFDRTHVLTVSYVYMVPSLKIRSRLAAAAVNGWGIQGVTVAETGQPFSIIDFSGTAASIFFSSDDFITNPILPLAPGVSVKQATTGGTVQSYNSGTNVGVRVPYVNPDSFSIPFLSPGQSGVPPCGPTVGGTSANFCDNLETGYGGNGRNLFRAPAQVRFDLSIFKNFKITERVALKFQADAFNLFNHPSFDAPNGNFTLDPCFNPQPCFGTTPLASSGNPDNFGVIQQTVGSNRFLQLSAHLTF
jgi:Carboxypeptidase regulatory-like domain/TonB dependent receptor